MSEPHPQTRTIDREIKIWVTWLQNLAALGAALLKLGSAELALAAADLKRLLIVSILMVPIILMAWTGLSCLAAWLVMEQSGSVAWGLFSFCLIQIMMLAFMYSKIASYRHSLSLPNTRAQINNIIEDLKNESGFKTDTNSGPGA